MAAPPPRTAISVHDAVLEYREALERRVALGNLSANSLNTYVRDLAEFEDLVGSSTVLDDLTSDDIEGALLRLARKPDNRYTVGSKTTRNGQPAEGRGAHSRARWVASVRGLFRWASDKAYVQIDPMLKVNTPKAPKKAAGARLGLPLNDALTLMDQAASTPRKPKTLSADSANRLSLRDQALLWLLAESGPRVSEVCNANASDLRLHEDTSRPVLRVRGKGSKDRDLPLSPGLSDLLNSYLSASTPAPDGNRSPAPSGRPLFLSIRNNRMSPRDVQRLVQKHVLTYGLPAVTPHGLRHTALTILTRSGVDIGTVAQIAGHENISTTSIYLDKSMQAAADAIDHSPIATARHIEQQLPGNLEEPAPVSDAPSSSR